ncbi:MAG: hypothetical protein PHQ83_03370 [Eubacteriales bacterium]|nr:hypothetical protein [Eubacteriales bacterium]
MNPFSGRMTSHQSESKRILTLLQNLRDLTLHCLQLVEQEEQDELSFWLIRRRACMEEIDQIQESSAPGQGLSAGAGLDDSEIPALSDLLHVIEILDQDLQRASTNKRDQYQDNLKKIHAPSGGLAPAAVYPATGRFLDRIG